MTPLAVGASEKTVPTKTRRPKSRWQITLGWKWP